MDKLPEFNAEEDTEEWIEVSECRAACSKVKDDKTKIQWCKSVIGSVGRRIIKGLPEGAQWRQAKVELRRYLGEDDPKSAAWKKLRGYRPKVSALGK